MWVGQSGAPVRLIADVGADDEAVPYPEWLIELMAECMPLCGAAAWSVEILTCIAPISPPQWRNSLWFVYDVFASSLSIICLPLARATRFLYCISEALGQITKIGSCCPVFRLLVKTLNTCFTWLGCNVFTFHGDPCQCHDIAPVLLKPSAKYLEWLENVPKTREMLKMQKGFRGMLTNHA